MCKFLDKLLVSKGFHYIITRYTPNRIKRLAFEQKMKQGIWDNTVSDKSDELLTAIRYHARKGNILCLGCGGGSLVAALSSDSYDNFIGVDISREAIKKAKLYESEYIKFELGDIRSFKTDLKFNVIVLEESLFYVPSFQRVKMLKRYKKCLTNEGVFVVTTDNYYRFGRMIKKIRQQFNIIEDRFFSNSSRHMCIFR